MGLFIARDEICFRWIAMVTKPEPSCAAFLQAGGKSSRMGENKAFVEFEGVTLLARALQTLRQACDDVVIVGDPEIYGPYGRVVSDVFPACGPLGGIHAALSQTSAELNLMLAVDMPFASAALMRFLFRTAGESNALVIVPRTSRGLQPLCGVYRPAFAAIAETAIRAGNYKIDAAFAGIPIEIVGAAELRAAGFSEREFFNVNTPDDRRRAADLIV